MNTSTTIQYIGGLWGQTAPAPLNNLWMIGTPSLNHFMMGAIAVAYAIAALFFFRFWVKTRDRLFIMFGVSFALLGLIRVGIFSLGEDEHHYYLYWFRFAAYALILLAIIDKNRKH